MRSFTSSSLCFIFFFFIDTSTTETYTLSLHDALPICGLAAAAAFGLVGILSANMTACIGWLFIASICITIPVSPLLVFVQEAVAENKLATTQAAFGLATQILGATPATALIGILSDAMGLQLALVFPFVACGIGGVVLLVTAKRG